MKLLLTGANGLVGRACQMYAKKFNFDTTIISSKKPIYKNFKCYKKLEDIENLNINYDLLIHCAAATPNNSDFEEIFKINRGIDKSLSEFIKKFSVRHIIYLSTMSVYGDIKVDILNEKTEINNPNEYGYSKFLGEIDVKESCIQNMSRLTILRLPGIVGKGMPNIFIRRLYESILNKKEIVIKSKEAKFNNSVTDIDIFLTSLNLFFLQDKEVLILNHHANNIVTLGELINKFSSFTFNNSIFNESKNATPPFLITNLNYDDLLVKSEMEDIMNYLHSFYK